MMEQNWVVADKLILNILVVADRLQQQLTEEAEILKSAPGADAIDTCTSNKKQLISQLEALNSQVSEILTSEQLPNNVEGMNEYFQRATASGILVSETMANWRQIQAICADCKALNEQNGASVELLSYHAKRSLDILKGKVQSANTYGRDGSSESDPITHSLTFYL